MNFSNIQVDVIDFPAEGELTLTTAVNRKERCNRENVELAESNSLSFHKDRDRLSVCCEPARSMELVLLGPSIVNART